MHSIVSDRCDGPQSYDCATTNFPDFRCSPCNYSTTLMADLRRHIGEDHVTTTKSVNCRLICKICDFVTYSKLLHDTHLCTKRVRICRVRHCPYCEFSTTWLPSLNVHMVARHTPPDHIRWFQCEHCPYRCKAKFRLHEHVVAKHTASEHINWFECDQCPYKAKLTRLLYRHKIIMHTARSDVRWHKCEYCDHRTLNITHLRAHVVAKHTSPEEINWLQCDICCGRFKTKKTLQRHKSVVHEPRTQPLGDQRSNKLFECEHCPLKVKRRQTLRDHQLMQHSDLAEWLSCTYCDYRTVIKHRLKRHMQRQHLNTEMFECLHCGFNFKQKGHLTVHIKTIHAVDRYKCKYCNFQTKYKTWLRKHTILKHFSGAHRNYLKCEFCPFKTMFETCFVKHGKAKHGICLGNKRK